MSQVLYYFEFSLSVVGPIFVLLCLGALLIQRGIINQAFVDVGSRLVFRVTLPLLLFLSIINSNLGDIESRNFVLFGVVSNLFAFAVIWLLCSYSQTQAGDKGVVIQGGFRGNLAVIGLAYVSNAYGEAGLALGALFVAGVTLLYNVLAVFTLNYGKTQGRSQIKSVLLEVLKNPLIIAIVFALAFVATGLQLPTVIEVSADYVASITLPLALICTGASLNFSLVKEAVQASRLASFYRLILAPLLITLLALLLGFRGIELGVIYLMSAAPTAAASYIMVKNIGGNAQLAANIVAITTALSLFSTSFGMSLLSYFALI